MTTIKTLATAILMTVSGAAVAQEQLRSNAHIGFVYPLSTNGVRALEYSNRFSIHAIAGVSRAEEAFCVSGVANVVKDSAKGFIAAGTANIIGGSADGCQAAGFINYVGGNTRGTQLGGFINLSSTVDGAQVGGFANVAMHEVKGAQIAGFINTADTATAQVAGFINVANRAKAQVAGFVNVAEEVDGTQIAGFINVARKVNGVQIAGFINIADSSDCPIGIINIIGNGEQALGVTVNEIGTTMLTFRSGGRKLYGILGVGGNYTGGYRGYALEAGVGMHIPVRPNFRFNTEVSVTSLSDLWINTDIRTDLRFMPAVKLGNVEIFAGPTFSYTGTNDIQGVGRVGYTLWDYESFNYTHNFAIGGVAGIQYHFNSKRILNSLTKQKNLSAE